MVTRQSFACQNGHFENTIAFSLTLLRDLLSFENCRGGQNGFVVGALPPASPLATALVFRILVTGYFTTLSTCILKGLQCTIFAMVHTVPEIEQLNREISK